MEEIIPVQELQIPNEENTLVLSIEGVLYERQEGQFVLVEPYPMSNTKPERLVRMAIRFNEDGSIYLQDSEGHTWCLLRGDGFHQVVVGQGPKWALNRSMGVDESFFIEPAGPMDSLSLEDALRELRSWAGALHYSVGSSMHQIAETRKPGARLPASCPSVRAMVAMEFRQVEKKYEEVQWLMELVQRKIRQMDD